MSGFVDWFYNGLGHLGGWLIFVVLGVGIVIWLFADSVRRHLPANVWRLGAFLSASALLAPATAIKVNGTYYRDPAALLAVLGVLGGVIPAALWLVYSLKYRGLVGCVKGHKPYKATLAECPVCARRTIQGLPGIKVERQGMGDSSQGSTGGRKTSRGAVKSDKPRADAWLVDDEGSIYQINLGETTIGRAPTNDLRLWEGSASRTHAKIVVEGDSFVIYDLASVAGTWINGQRVRRPEVLNSGDSVTFGASTRMVFTTRPEELQ